MTPESKVKKKVKDLFKDYKDHGEPVYAFWPVQTGYGAKTLDCIGSSFGRFFAVETKRDGKDLTEYQKLTRAEIEAAGAVVFRVSNDEELQILKDWLENEYTTV